MFRGIRRYSTAIQTIAIVGICAIILGATIVSKPRAATCPCGVGAAFVAATGSTITAFTLAEVTELYLVLWQGFAAIHTQINGNTGSNQETMSYQTQAVAQVHRQRLGYRQTMDSMRPATIGFQMSATSGAGGAELNTNLVRDAIMEENHAWQTNMDEGTAYTNPGNASYNNNKRLTKYCNQREAALDLCDLPEDPRHIDADIDASTLEPQTLDENMVAAAIDRCRNLVGLPNAAPSASEYQTPEGRVELASRDTGNARALTSFALCDYLVAIRTELPEESIRAWAEEVVQRITGGVGLPPPPSSCRPMGGGYGGAGGGANMPYIPTSCAPFQDGFQYPNYGTLASDQVNVMNLVYSELVSYGISHYAAMAVAMTTIEESNAGRTMREAWNSSCPAAIQGATMCALPPISGARTDCTPAGNCGYVPTGLGLIQWSGWQEDGCWGRGCDLQRAINPNTGMNFQKCDLIAAADGGCAPDHETAIKNNVAGLMANLSTDQGLYNQLTQPFSDPHQAASLVTNEWIRPYAAARARRPGDMTAAINGQGLHDGSCGPGVGGTTTTVSTGTTGTTGTSPVVRSTGGATADVLAGVPGTPVSVPLQSPMQGSVQQTDCFGYRANRQPNPTFHKGIDLVSSNPTVYAAGAGTIIAPLRTSCVEGGSCSTWGNSVYIQHADGTVTQYNHLATGNPNNLVVGMTVSAGQPIGVMGNTGASFGAHLDFVVHTPDGHQINPHAVLSGLPDNRCGTNMGTIEHLALLDDGTRIGLDGSLQSPGGVGTSYANGGAGGNCGATADLGLNIDAEHISHLELMKLVSEYRFKDPGWSEFVLTSASRGQLIREFNAVEATKMYMNWKAYERQVQTAAVLSAWAGAEAETRYKDATRIGRGN